MKTIDFFEGVGTRIKGDFGSKSTELRSRENPINLIRDQRNVAFPFCGQETLMPGQEQLVGYRKDGMMKNSEAIGQGETQATAMEDRPRYEHEVRVTFCLTNAEGNMSHDEYTRLFGVVRELMGLDLIPGFKEEVGSRYLLKTKHAFYEYRRDFHFGDTIRVRIGVAEVTGASFTLQAEFINAASGEIHAMGRQQIVYADIEGHPRRLPQELKELLMMMLNGNGNGRGKEQ